MHFDVSGLRVVIDDATGQLLSITDTDLEREIIAFEPDAEIGFNGVPMATEHVATKSFWGTPRTEFDIRQDDSYMTGARYAAFRTIVPMPGHGFGGRDRGRSVHLRYSVRRQPWGDFTEELCDLWEHPIEAPARLSHLTLLGAPMRLFGERTHVRSIAIGGSGPREHVSIEDAPLREVLPIIHNKFRTAFPGQSMIPGAMFYDPDDERWVWILTHQPTIGGRVAFNEHGLSFRFEPFKEMGLQDRIQLPDISIYYGQGLDEADRVLAELFDQYREPPSWWWHTTWFWMHPLWVRDNTTFADMRATVDHLMDDCGINGIGLIVHDRLPTGLDCECLSPRASDLMGGEDDLRSIVQYIRSKGGHTFTWMARYGKLATGGPKVWRDDWALQGIDGRPVGHEQFHMCDALSPGFADYLKRWIRYYVVDIGIDGIFWDSAFQPFVANFSEASKGWLNCPGEASAGAPALYQELYEYGKSLHDDFFMWGEGINNNTRMNAFAVDNARHGEHSGHLQMHRIAHAGARRLVWRSAFRQDVAGAFPFVQPMNDCGASGRPDFYRDLAADPMNRWLCRTVKERGCKQARGIADGIAVLDEFIVVGASEGLLGRVVVPDDLARGTRLVHEISGTAVTGTAVDGGVAFDLTETGAWRMQE